MDINLLTYKSVKTLLIMSQTIILKLIIRWKLNVEDDLEAFYFGDLFINKYKGILCNITLRVYKDVLYGIEKKYNLTDIYYGDKGCYFI